MSVLVILNVLFLPLVQLAPLDIEGEREMQNQNSQNAVPRLGKRAAAPGVGGGIDVPSFTSGLLPQLPKFLTSYPRSRGKRAGNAPLQLAQIYARLREADRSKRAPVANDWSSSWDNVLRSPQGFRLYDGSSDYLSNAVMYKRAQDFTSQLNNVPMMGKRAPAKRAPAFVIDDSEEAAGEEAEGGSDTDPDYWWLFPEEQDLMADASLYPPVLGPHYRTILTRVQKRTNQLEPARDQK